MPIPDLKIYTYRAIIAALSAGDAIMEIYNSVMDFGIEAKADDSPLTVADKKSHEVISSVLHGDDTREGLKKFPILSEEGRCIHFTERKAWDFFWLIDPLDGTKEFIRRNGEFTVNIALIHEGKPIAGVVFVPVQGILYFAAEGLGAYRVTAADINPSALKDITAFMAVSEKLPVRSADGRKTFTVIASRSHMNRETEEFIDGLREKHGQVELISAGSSLKLCYVAEGRARVYPRLGPTMEWDTAAAQAVVNGAGKRVLLYNS